MLELLLAAEGRSVSAEQLLDRAWDEYLDTFSNVVKVTISRLRRKLGAPPAIETVPGGYRIVAMSGRRLIPRSWVAAATAARSGCGSPSSTARSFSPRAPPC